MCDDMTEQHGWTVVVAIGKADTHPAHAHGHAFDDAQWVDVAWDKRTTHKQPNGGHDHEQDGGTQGVHVRNQCS